MKLKHGDQKRLADAAGVSVQFINDIVQGRKHCPGSLAVKLELISEQVLGRKVLAKEWILAGLGMALQKGGRNDHGLQKKVVEK